MEGLPQDKVAEALVRAIVDLSHALGMEVIAEGVETPDQRRTLATNGCRAIQGFLVGRPCVSTNVDALVASLDGYVKALT